MALHHAKLDAITSALTRLLRPHGRLFVYDFDWDAYDDRAADWLAEHDSCDAGNSVPGWQREHGDLHTGATINEALDVRFKPLLKARRPYLARMLARHDLEAMEHALIDAQMLPALGFWMIAEHARLKLAKGLAGTLPGASRPRLRRRLGLVRLNSATGRGRSRGRRQPWRATSVPARRLKIRIGKNCAATSTDKTSASSRAR